MTATRSSTHLADAKRGCPSLSSRKSTPHSTQGYRWAHELPLSNSELMGRQCQVGGRRPLLLNRHAARPRGARERGGIAPARLPRAGADPLSRRRRRSLYTTAGGHLPSTTFCFFGFASRRLPEVVSNGLDLILYHAADQFTNLSAGDYCFPVGRLCFTKWRQTPGIGTQVPQRSREGKTERTGRAQPR